jgi:hypothetical protein
MEFKNAQLHGMDHKNINEKKNCFEDIQVCGVELNICQCSLVYKKKSYRA